MNDRIPPMQTINFDDFSYPIFLKDAAKVLRAVTHSSDISLGGLHAICIQAGWLKRGTHLEVEETEEGKRNGVTVVDRAARLSRTGFARLVSLFPATYWL